VCEAVFSWQLPDIAKISVLDRTHDSSGAKEERQVDLSTSRFRGHLEGISGYGVGLILTEGRKLFVAKCNYRVDEYRATRWNVARQERY
jgi:hypothetical protein